MSPTSQWTLTRKTPDQLPYRLVLPLLPAVRQSSLTRDRVIGLHGLSTARLDWSVQCWVRCPSHLFQFRACIGFLPQTFCPISPAPFLFIKHDVCSSACRQHRNLWREVWNDTRWMVLGEWDNYADICTLTIKLATLVHNYPAMVIIIMGCDKMNSRM